MVGPARGSRACEALAEQRSALVDGALGDADRERVLAHLVACDACRADVAELRRIRRLLNDRTRSDTNPSYDLADRLVAIAGRDAQEPLLAAPFRPSTSGALRHRRGRGGRALVGIGTVGATAVLVVAVGLSAAPSQAGVLTDPTAGAQAEFSALTAQLPLADSVGAVLMAGGQTLSAGSQLISPEQPLGPVADLSAQRELDEVSALAVLRRAAASADEVSFRGTQRFQVLSDGRVLAAQYPVETRVGNGREVVVLDANGRPLRSAVTTPTLSRVGDSDELELLADNYLLVGSRGAQVAGHAATVVSAIRFSGLTAARWWVDDDSGLLLWHETYDQGGRTSLSAGFTSVRIGEPDSAGQLPAPVSAPLTNMSLTLGNTDQLVADGWICPRWVAGLSLVRLRSDSATSPTVLHLGYTDGLSSVSVFEQRGSLAHAPSGTTWDNGLEAYVRGGAAKVATWQSGSTVFTVVTDGSHDQLAAAVRSLPHDATPPRTTIDRVRAGWSRILESVAG